MITADALNTQTRVMEQIISQGGHFVMMVKKNQPASYEEIIEQFEEMKKDQGRMAEDSAWKSRYPQFMEKYDEVTYSEKNRDRYEYRNYKIINDASFVSKTEKQWPFLKSVGCAEQIRILIVKDEDGNDITPSKEQFLREGSVRQPAPLKGDGESTDIQVVGIISDKEMSAEEMGWCKRNHWSVENRLHHVLDDTFREDRSPARGSRNNLALIRKFALNVLRLVQIQTGNRSPISEMMDLLNDDSELLGRYVFGPIESLY
jgi:predicted transposase YbfD/YdcC